MTNKFVVCTWDTEVKPTVKVKAVACFTSRKDADKHRDLLIRLTGERYWITDHYALNGITSPFMNKGETYD